MNQLNLGHYQRWLWLAVWPTVWLIAAAVLAFGIRPANPQHGIGGPGALTQGVLAGKDTLTHDYPAAWWGWSQVKKTGNIPLWNPSWFCGEPFVASQTFMPFYPLNWLGWLLPFPLAFNIQYPLHLLLAAAVMAWACRARGLGWLAAGLAGLSWGFGGHLATLAGPGHIQKLQTLAWLPLVTLGAWRLARGEARRGVIPFGLGLALQITAGHLQIVYLTLGVAAIEALGALVTAPPLHLPRRFVNAGWALALALGLSAIFWVPTAEFASLSNREGKLSWEDVTRGSLPPEEALEFLLPRLRGDSMPFGRGAQWSGGQPGGSYMGRYGESSTSSPERIVSDYAGAGVIVFALLGLLLGWRARRWAALGYILLAAAALALSIGKYCPGFYRFALAAVPGLAHFRSPSTMMALLAYGLTMAAALGLDGFARLGGGETGQRNALDAVSDPAPRRKRLRILGVVLLAAALAAAGVFAWSERELLALQRAAPLFTTAPTLQAGVAAFLRQVAVAHASRGFFLVLLLAGLWALVMQTPAARRGRLTGGVLLALLTLVWGHDLLTNARAFWNAEDVRPYEKFLLSHWAVPLWTRSDDPVRYLELGNELSNRALTLSNFAMRRSVGSASGYHPVAYQKYFDLQRRLGFINPSFLRLFAVNYLLWPQGNNKAVPEGYHEYLRGPGQILLHNPEIAYVRPVVQIQTVRNWDDLLNRLATPGFNPYESTSVLEQDVGPKFRGKRTTWPDMHLQTRIYPVAPGETQIRTSSLKTGTIIVAEPAVPGWCVWIDNVFMPYMPKTVDGYFISIWLPAGQHLVRLVYDPISQRLGLYLTLLTLAALGGLAGRRLGERWAQRKTRPEKIQPKPASRIGTATDWPSARN